MRQRAEVLTSWTGSGVSEFDAKRPVIGDVYSLPRTQDVTGQPAESIVPDPNFEQVYIEAEDTVMAEIAADPDFTIVLGPENIPEEGEEPVPVTASNDPTESPGNSAWGAFRASLAQQGWKQADINAAYGGQVNGRVWKEISDEGKVWLKALPKATGGTARLTNAIGTGDIPAEIELGGNWGPGTRIKVRIRITENGDSDLIVHEFTPETELPLAKVANALAKIIDRSLLYNATSPGPRVRISPEDITHTLTVVVIVQSV